LVRVGVVSIAAGGVAVVIGCISYICVPHDAGPANAGLRAAPLGAVAGMTRSKRVDAGATVAGPRFPTVSDARLASLETGDDLEFALRWQDNPSEPMPARASFDERFAFEQPGATSSLQSSQASVSFDDRFGSEALASRDTDRPAAGAPRATGPRTTTAAAAPRKAARSAAAQATPKRPPPGQYQLASAVETSVPLAYAPSDTAKGSRRASYPNDLTPKDSDPLADIDTTHTAIYDIGSRTVYLPNGRRLEAHSGLGDQMDDARYVAKRGTGPTPPNVYDLKMRESLFHGVRAIRLIPKDESGMHGRSGILAHSYMLGPNGQSNGCVSFSDYSAFLEAYLRGEITRLVVVERLADAPSPKTASDWISNTLKDIFRRS
jgi:hypothetical protein